jgi:very-long-chain (3R)-3-hydroxyacyl-CoA dehydratase
MSFRVTATSFLNVTQKALVAAAAVFPALLIKAYLVTYNLLSAAGWSFVLYRTISHLCAIHSPPAPPRAPVSLLAGLKAPPSSLFWIPSFVPANLVPLYQRACTTYDAVGATTASVQTAAVLEILHVLLGFVRSSLATTTIQVASRFFSVWAIAACFPSVRVPSFRVPRVPTYLTNNEK